MRSFLAHPLTTVNVTSSNWELDMNNDNDTNEQTLREEVQDWLAQHFTGDFAKALGKEGFEWGASEERKAWLGMVVEARWAVPR